MSRRAGLQSFGGGVLTFTMPFLFRTPPGIDLWVKGPSNWIKDGVQPLEGVVETDWAVSTFTMNWKLTRPDLVVRFERDEPICMIVPVARGLAESLAPRRMPIGEAPETQEQYEAWSRSRSEFNTMLSVPNSEAVRRGWQKDYTLGLTPSGHRAPGHRTSLPDPGFHHA